MLTNANARHNSIQEYFVIHSGPVQPVSLDGTKSCPSTDGTALSEHNNSDKVSCSSDLDGPSAANRISLPFQFIFVQRDFPVISHSFPGAQQHLYLPRSALGCIADFSLRRTSEQNGRINFVQPAVWHSRTRRIIWTRETCLRSAPPFDARRWPVRPTLKDHCPFASPIL